MTLECFCCCWVYDVLAILELSMWMIMSSNSNMFSSLCILSAGIKECTTICGIIMNFWMLNTKNDFYYILNQGLKIWLSVDRCADCSSRELVFNCQHTQQFTVVWHSCFRGSDELLCTLLVPGIHVHRHTWWQRTHTSQKK